MADAPTNENRRREFLRGLVRAPLLGGLGLLGGGLAVRSFSGPIAPDEKCISRGLCRRCGQLARCGQPSATMMRDFLENGKRLI